MTKHLKTEEFTKFLDVLNDAVATLSITASKEESVVMSFGSDEDLYVLISRGLFESPEFTKVYLNALTIYAKIITDKQDTIKLKQLRKVCKQIERMTKSPKVPTDLYQHEQ